MKKFTVIILLLTSITLASQERVFEKEVQKIAALITQVTAQEKQALKQKVHAISLRLSQKELTEKQADSLKLAAATLHAKAIEVRVGLEEQKLQKLVQERVAGKIKSVEHIAVEHGNVSFTIGDKKQLKVVLSEGDETDFKKHIHKKVQSNRKTTSQFVFAFGVNNVLENNKLSSLDNSSYEFWKSHFYEVGMAFKTRLSPVASKTYVKYGVSFLWNNLRAKSNQYHVIDNGGVSLATHENSLSEGRLRHVQMVFPVHLEMDFSKNKTLKSGFVRDRVHQSVRLGLGGFAGFTLGAKQYLEYKNEAGVEIEEIQKSNFEMNTIQYGLSAYVAYKSTGLYVKYDLRPLFKDTDIRNVSFGLRFDLN